MDRGARLAAVCGIAKSQTRLSTHTACQMILAVLIEHHTYTIFRLILPYYEMEILTCVFHWDSGSLTTEVWFSAVFNP